MNDPRPTDEMLLAVALARPAVERAAFLDGACANDPARRARLEGLLQVLNVAQAAPVTADVRASAQEALLTKDSEEEIGTAIGHYKLLEKLGEGGFGVVYVAEQKEPVKRRVALKIIKLGMDTRQVVARFEAERQALALMDHPNIAKVLDAGATETGRPYFVMELVRGIKITDYCDQNNLPTGERLNLFVQICHAIQHAHQKGIIHRDIKPSNLLVTLHDGVPVPKVIDFGIAKATQGELTDKTVYTQLHQCIGTPAYMSPEQAEMSGLDVDTRSDIYSLGVLLYELLTGGTPFDKEELAKAGWDEVRRTIREREPLRPSTRLSKMQPANATELARRRGVDVPRLVAQLRGDLDWIVMRCLEKDRTRRYETANGLAMDIARHLHNEPVTACPPSTAYRLRKLVQRNRLAFAATAAVVLALIFGLIGTTWQMVRATRAEREQISLRMHAEANEKKAWTAEARADTARRQAQANAYAAEMNLAQEAYADGRLARALSLLEKHLPRQSKADDLRGFEWRHLWRLCQEGDALATFDPQISNIAAVSFAAGGKIVVCSEGGVTRVFDLSTRKETVRLDLLGTVDASAGPENVKSAPSLTYASGYQAAKRVAVSANGETVAVILADGTVRLWRLGGRQESLVVPVDGTTSGVTLSRDGRILAISGERGIRLWDCLPPHEIGVVPLATGTQSGPLQVFSSDGSRLAVSGDHVQVGIIDVAERKEVARLERRHTGILCAVAFSPDGRTLATSGYDTSIKLSDRTSGQVIARLPGSANMAWHLAFSPDGSILAAAGDGETVLLWDVSNRTNPAQKRTLRGHRDKVTALAFSSDGAMLVTGSADGAVKVWRIEEPSSNLLQGHENWAYSVAFSPDSKMLASGSHDGTIRFWDARTGVSMATIPAAPSDVFTVAFTPDGRTLAASEGRWFPSTGAAPRRVSLWNVADRREVASLAKDSCFPRGLDISSDGKTMVSGDWDFGQVTLWALPTGKEIASFPVHAKRLNAVKFSPDSRFLATSIGRGEVKLWDAATRREIARFDCENRSYGPNMDFSPDSRVLAIGWYQIELWSTDDRRLLARLGGHRAAILSVRFSPDGKTLATGSADHTVKLWNVAVQQEVATLRGHTDAVSGLAFSADGTMLASSGVDKTIRVWRAISPADMAELKPRPQP